MTDFNALLNQTAIVSKQTKNKLNEWQGDVPPAAIEWVATAHKNQDKRVVIPCKDAELAKTLHSAIRAAHAQTGNPQLEVHGRPVFDKDKNMTHFAFSVGAKRARKTA